MTEFVYKTRDPEYLLTTLINIQNNPFPNKELENTILEILEEKFTKGKSPLIQFAHTELKRAGFLDEDADYGLLTYSATMLMVTHFVSLGNSGSSANLIENILHNLLRFNSLSPLTGEDDEWFEYETGEFQNKRCSSVFKRVGNGEIVAYDLNAGPLFKNEDSDVVFSFGRYSYANITFPYYPKTEREVITMDKDDEWLFDDLPPIGSKFYFKDSPQEIGTIYGVQLYDENEDKLEIMCRIDSTYKTLDKDEFLKRARRVKPSLNGESSEPR